MRSTIQASAKKVLISEAKAIEKLAENMDAELGIVFEKVIKTILDLKGRVVLTGMGKSGHIAKKIAATLASTGTPAFFIHPAEASHGDMGMLTKDDMIIALSKSGNTNEINDIIHFAARYNLFLVAITENKNSDLAKLANAVLQIPQEPEACPLGAAPTTSTTLMLALGDALAITLLVAKGFTAEDFNTYHPGGHLGKKLMLVRDIMHGKEELPLTSKETPMSEALLIMTKYSFGCLGIVEHEKLIGLITDGDLRRNMRENLLEKKVHEVMHVAPTTIEGNTLVAAALQLMNTKKITSLFVIKDGKPVGILHIHDCLRSGLQ